MTDNALVPPPPAAEGPAAEGPGASLPPPPAAAAPPVAPGGIEFGKLAWGLVLVTLGGVMLLDRFDLFDVGLYWQFWPLILIVLGGVSLVGARTPGKRRSALWLLGLGLWALVNTRGWLGLDWEHSWPLVVILAGVIGLIQPRRKDGGRFAALWPLALGLWLLVNVFGWWGFRWDNSWPLLLILIGGLLVARALTEGWLGARSRETGEAGDAR